MPAISRYRGEGAVGRGLAASASESCGSRSPAGRAENVRRISRAAAEQPDESAIGRCPDRSLTSPSTRSTAYVMSWDPAVRLHREPTASAAGSGRSTSPTPRAPRQLSFNQGVGQELPRRGRARDHVPGRPVTCSRSTTRPAARRRPRRRRRAAASISRTSAIRPTRSRSCDAAGDYGPIGNLVCCTPNAPGADAAIAHSSHSCSCGSDGAKVYLVGVDNAEQTRPTSTSSTSPIRPRRWRSASSTSTTSSTCRARRRQRRGTGANGNAIFLHDMVVKEIDGVQTMLASYWDGGYMLLNVEQPGRRRTYIGDTDVRRPPIR